MKKIIIVAIIVLLALAGVWYFATQNKDNGTVTPNSAKVNSVQGQTESAGKADNKTTSQTVGDFVGTISDLMAKKTPVKCSAQFEVDGSVQKQVIYFDGKNMRMEMAMNIDKFTNNIFVLIKDDWQYIWNKGDMPGIPTKGTKIEFTEADRQKQQTQAKNSANQSVDISRTMNFSCQPWAVDATMFDLPADIQFEDMTAQMKQNMQTAPTNACDACEKASVEAVKAACRKANCPQ